jgi:hypothetical protein
MSITGISSSSLFQQSITQSVQNKFQQIQSQFQQLGQDLQAGNLSQAQQDFATLTQNLPAAQQQNSTSTLSQAFNTLGQDLKAGNLSAAQQDFTAIQQDVKEQSGQVQHHHHHRLASDSQDSNSATSGQQSNPLAQAFGALGQALQSGSLSSAQQAYATLQQDLQQFLPNAAGASSGAISASATSLASGALNINV